MTLKSPLISLALATALAAIGCNGSDSDAGGGGGAAAVTSATGSSVTGTEPVNQPPKALFTTAPASGPAPLSVTFDASGSKDSDGTIVSYGWDLDGATDTGKSITHSFTEVGCHPIELTVTDDDGATGTATGTVVVASGTPEVPPAVTIEVAPIASAVLPRDVTTDEGTAHFEGSLASDGYTGVRADVMDGDTVVKTVTVPLCGAAPVDFALDVPVASELKAFDIKLSLIGVADPQEIYSVTDLVAGDIYVIQGQSNAVSAKQSGDANENQTPFVRSFGSNTEDGAASEADKTWRMAEGNAGGGPGAVGQWPLRMASLLSAAHETPIGIINGARGGKPIAYFQRNDENTIDPTTNYGRLLTRLRNGHLESSIRAFLWYQGENDGANFQAHHDGFVALRADWAEDYAGVTRTYVTQIHTGSCGGDIRTQDVQRKLADEFPDITVMSTNGLNGHDNCHYAYEDGYRELGDRYAGLLGRDFYAETPAHDVQPPNPDSAQFAGGGTKVVIKLRNASSALTIDDGASANFRIEGSEATVTGATTSGNTITLTIDGDASNATGVSYLGHAMSGPWVLNENAIGLLGFYDVAIAAE